MKTSIAGCQQPLGSATEPHHARQYRRADSQLELMTWSG
jgi:hypothetical protein